MTIPAQTAPAPTGLTLALDTCGPETTLALGRYQPGGGAVDILAERTLPARTAGSLLTGALAALLEATRPPTRPNHLAAIVVVRGPGSFTGMRIGLSAAKALSEATGVPLVAVSRLAVLLSTSGAPAAALSAGRGNLYLSQHPAQPSSATTGPIPEPDREAMLTAGEVRARLGVSGEPSLALCEDKVQALFPQARRVAVPTATHALAFAQPRVHSADWDDPATLDALYLWRAEQMLTKPPSPPPASP